MDTSKPVNGTDDAVTRFKQSALYLENMEMFEKFERFSKQNHKLLDVMSAYNKDWIRDISLDNEIDFPIAFHKAYWAEKHNAMLLETASKYQSSPLPVLGHERLLETDSEKIGFTDIQYHRVGAGTIAIVWKSFDSDYILFTGWSRSIILDLPFFLKSTSNGGDTNTDLFYLVTYDKNFAGEQTLEREEFVKVMMHRQLRCKAETDPVAYVKKSEPGSMVAVKLTEQTINKILTCQIKSVVPVCQIPFGLGGYSGILEKVYGFCKDKTPKLEWRNNINPIFPVFPNLYSLFSGILLNGLDNVVVGTFEQLITLFSSSEIQKDLDMYEKVLLMKLCII